MYKHLHSCQAIVQRQPKFLILSACIDAVSLEKRDRDDGFKNQTMYSTLT